jgi:putative NADPH-quinone reductase
MKKKILVVLGHPDAESFNAAIYKTFVENIDRKKCDVETIELGKMKFDPVLRFGYREFMKPDADIERSQELIKWAEHIVFIYPIWWSSMPSLLKGWLDRVLTPGFAYNMKGARSEKHLAGRTAELIVTCNAPAFYYRFLDRLPIKLMRKQILGMCGLKVNKILICGKTDTLNEEGCDNFLGEVAREAQTRGGEGR